MAVWQVRAGADGLSSGMLNVGGCEVPVLIGRTGMKAAADKREGDGATPMGTWRILYGFYRADRHAKPAGGLPWLAIQPDMGWCDAPEDALYNQMVPKGYPASHEEMWREDTAYDFVLILNHNQQPVTAGAGSAVFMHVWRDGADCTAGCVALKGDVMRTLVDGLGVGQIIEIV